MQVLLDEYVDAGGVAAVARQGGDRRLEYSYCISRKACSFLKCERKFVFAVGWANLRAGFRGLGQL